MEHAKEDEVDDNFEFEPDSTKHHVVFGRPGVMVVSEASMEEWENKIRSLSSCFASIKNRIVTTSKEEIRHLFTKHA